MITITILHRIFNCNHKLYIWGIRNSPDCSRCGRTDNLEHFFYYCHEIQNFWLEIKNWLMSISINLQLTVLEIILGCIYYEESLFHCVNYIILMGKHFINSSREKTNLSLTSFLNFLKNKMKIVQESFIIKDQHTLFVSRFGYLMSKLE